MEFLYLLEDIRSPFWDRFMQLVTYCGEELIFMVLALVIYWCVSKAEGYYLLFTGFVGTVVNQFLKLLCRIPRPWVKDPEFQAVESALPGATGYSFPSGHTQSVTGVFGCLARWHKELWLRVAAVAIILLTSFSRMYLGVHTPLDVGVSLGVGILLVFGLYPIVRSAAADPKKMYVLLGVMSLLSLLFVLFANFWPFPQDMDPANLASGRKNSYTIFGCLMGFIVGYTIEHRSIRFPTKAVWWAQILKVVLGLLGLILIKEGMKPLLEIIGYTHVSANALRYGLMVVFATGIWPLTFSRWAELGQKA